MSTADSVIYLKKSLKLLWQRPGIKSIFSFFRYYPAWREHLKPGRNSVDDQTPWMSFAAIDFLNKMAHPDMRIFEYGSGGSTMFWAARGGQVVSVEHDLEWFNRMKKHLEKLQVTNVEYLLSEAGPDPGFQEKLFTNPADYISAGPEYAGKNFEDYVKTIDRFPDEFFEVIVVDGRARPSCIQHGIPKLKKNGWLIIDNTERAYYLSPFDFDRNSWKFLKFAGPVPYTRDFSETSFLKKLI